MEKITQKTKLFQFLVFMFFAITSFALITIRDNLGISNYAGPSESEFRNLKTGAIFFSIYAFIMPWIIERFFLPRFRMRKDRIRMRPENLILLMSYLMLYLPVISGNLLYRLGLPILQAYYFKGAGMLVASIWCAYTLRKNATW